MFILGGQILSRWDAISDATTLLLGLALPDCNAHSPKELMRTSLPCAWRMPTWLRERPKVRGRN